MAHTRLGFSLRVCAKVNAGQGAQLKQRDPDPLPSDGRGNSLIGRLQGDLLSDLTRRRGNILAVEPGERNVLVNAHVPLAELWGYANAIRSLSRGRASYSMTPSHFERVPEGVTAIIVNMSDD